MQHRTSTPWPPPDVSPASASVPNRSTAPWPPPDVSSAPSRAPQPPPGMHSIPRTAARPSPDVDAGPRSPALPPGMHPNYPCHEHFAPQRDAPPRPRSHPPPAVRPDSPPAPAFLIIGLFALRLAHRLISSLDPYCEQHADLSWLDNFLARYGADYDLAVLRGAAKEVYLDVYPRVVGTMKKQRDFPRVFMKVNPLPRVFGVRRESEREGGRRRDESREREEISDAQRREAIDFVHAAAEWGSVVLVPEKEAERMMVLAERRRVADRERDYVDEREARRGVGVGAGAAAGGERVRSSTGGWTTLGLPHGSPGKREVRFAPDGRF